MPPIPTPTAADIVSLMDVMGENDYAFVLSLVNAGSDEEAMAKWEATLEDMDEWRREVRGNYVALDGDVKLSPELPEAKIRRRVRLRYGLTAEVAAVVTGEYPGSRAVPVEAW